MDIGPFELFGTPESPPARRRLVAGPLSAMLEDGNLRDVRFGGVEIVRAINYLARDAAWGTFKPAISNLDISQEADAFSVGYRGLCGEPGTGFAYTMHIRGEASGRLTMEADGVALDDFLTNRTGFVILHAAEAAGGRMDIFHSDGSLEKSKFPRLISADQPAFDIAQITHDAAPGLACTIEMEGDAFEMEDQRNWADASFKTYVRPLSKPRPYVIAKGSPDRQRVVVSVEGGSGAAAASGKSSGRVELGAAGRMPAIALFIDDFGLGPLSPEDAPEILVARLDTARADSAEQLSRVAGFAKQARASVAVELVLSARDPDVEAAGALGLIDAAGLVPSALMVSPRREFKTRGSNMLPEDEAPIDAIVKALRQAGFPGRIGAGTPSYFTEFNRNPPGTAGDFVFFSVAGIVHAADDVSVAETIDVYPTLIDSARALCPGKPVWLGPCTIGVRHNPYGAATQPNPSGLRIPSATVDPRQSGLFGAAYAAAAAAQAATSGVEALTLGAVAGPFGMFNADGSPRPIHAIARQLAEAAGLESHVLLSVPQGVHGIAYRTGRGLQALIANLGGEPASLAVPVEFTEVSLLQPDANWSAAEPLAENTVLPPYRTALLSAWGWLSPSARND